MKALRRSFLCSNFKEYAILAKAFSSWLAFFFRAILYGAQMSVYYQNGYPEAFTFTVGDGNLTNGKSFQ